MYTPVELFLGWVPTDAMTSNILLVMRTMRARGLDTVGWANARWFPLECINVSYDSQSER